MRSGLKILIDLRHRWLAVTQRLLELLEILLITLLRIVVFVDIGKLLRILGRFGLMWLRITVHYCDPIFKETPLRIISLYLRDVSHLILLILLGNVLRFWEIHLKTRVWGLSRLLVHWLLVIVLLCRRVIIMGITVIACVVIILSVLRIHLKIKLFESIERKIREY